MTSCLAGGPPPAGWPFSRTFSPRTTSRRSAPTSSINRIWPGLKATPPRRRKNHRESRSPDPTPRNSRGSRIPPNERKKTPVVAFGYVPYYIAFGKELSHVHRHHDEQGPNDHT